MPKRRRVKRRRIMVGRHSPWARLMQLYREAEYLAKQEGLTARQAFQLILRGKIRKPHSKGKYMKLVPAKRG